MENYQIAIIAAVVVLAVVLFFVFKNRKKKDESPVDLDALFEALGGQDNVVSVEANGSKVKVVLKDNNAVDAEALKGLGATGVVSTSKATQIIFGKVSEDIVKYMKNRL